MLSDIAPAQREDVLKVVLYPDNLDPQSIQAWFFLNPIVYLKDNKPIGLLSLTINNGVSYITARGLNHGNLPKVIIRDVRDICYAATGEIFIIHSTEEFPISKMICGNKKYNETFIITPEKLGVVNVTKLIRRK